MMCFGIAQKGEFWEEKGEFGDTQFGGSKNSYMYFVVKKPQILFLIDQKFYLVVFISFPHNTQFCCNSNGVLVI